MNFRKSGCFFFSPILFVCAAIVAGCASTGKTDEAVREWDRLSAQNEALQERIDLLEERLVACNSQRLDSSAVIQFQEAMIESKRYPTNWDLAAARAVSVIRKLESSGIPGRRLVAGAFGEYSPVATNDTEEGRTKNRRIEFRIVPIVRSQ